LTRLLTGPGVWLVMAGLGLVLILRPFSPALDRPVGNPPDRSANWQLAPTPAPPYNPTATPTTQGGHGANLFYVYCMPCHGDVGQGLTDEFRFREYPPEDTNCWKSGCHGDRPYEDGFTLPKTVPAIIGAGTLQKFKTAQELYGFIRAAMPFNAPGSLESEQYLFVTAFLLEQNRLIASGRSLDPAALSSISVAPDGLAAPDLEAATDQSSLLPGLAAFFGIAVILLIITRSRRTT